MASWTTQAGKQTHDSVIMQFALLPKIFCQSGKYTYFQLNDSDAAVMSVQLLSCSQ
jgi:hypothetical protein